MSNVPCSCVLSLLLVVIIRASSAAAGRRDSRLARARGRSCCGRLLPLAGVKHRQRRKSPARSALTLTLPLTLMLTLTLTLTRSHLAEVVGLDALMVFCFDFCHPGTENGGGVLRQHHRAAEDRAGVLPNGLLRQEVSLLPQGEAGHAHPVM